MDDIAPSSDSQQNSDAVFPLAFEKSLVDAFGLSPGTIAEAAKNYFAAQSLIPGAPLISELGTSDGLAVLAVQNRADDETWEQFKERLLADDQQLIRLRDPYMPNWTGKEKASIFGESTQCTSEQQQRIDAECNRSKPVLNDKILNIVGTPPASSRIMEKMIGPAIVASIGLFARSMGQGPDPIFRWCIMLPMVLGLGVATAKQVAQKMAEGGFEDWAKWQNCSNDELKEDAIAAQRISGFPMVLLRTDFERMVRILESSDEVTVPAWFPALLTLHVIKHCRFCRFGERYYLFAAYKGVRCTGATRDGCAIDTVRNRDL